MNVRGARLARQAADEAGGRFVAGSVGPLNVTLSLSPRVEDPAYRAVTFDQVKAAYAEQIAALAEGGVDLLLIETIFDTLNAKAAIAAAREVAPRPAAVDLGDHRRPERPHPVRADRRGVLALDRARRAAGRRRELLARRGRDAPARRRAGPAGRHLRRPATPTPACPTPSAATTRRPEETAELLGEFAARRPGQHRRRLLRHHPGAHRADRRGGRGTSPPRADRRRPRRATRFSGLEPFAIGPDTGFVMIGERTNVTGSAKFRRLIEADDYQGAVDVALEQVRGGANLLDVNMDADLLDSEQAMTTFLNLIATEPEVARIPVMIDSSKWTRARGRPQVRAGQGRGQLDQPQGGRGAVPGAGPPDPRLRRRRGRDGLRRAGPGRHRRAQGGDLRPGVRPAGRARPGSRPTTSSSTRTCWPSPPASPSTTGTPRRSSTRCR